MIFFSSFLDQKSGPSTSDSVEAETIPSVVIIANEQPKPHPVQQNENDVENETLTNTATSPDSTLGKEDAKNTQDDNILLNVITVKSEYKKRKPSYSGNLRSAAKKTKPN